MSLAEFNPSMDFINDWRTLNVAVGLIACFALYFGLARNRWQFWNVPTRLGWLSLFWLCFTGTFGSLEVAFFDTYFRVPMVTAALLWAIIAAVWPKDKTDIWSKRK